ncbi:MAG: riboflavin synthase [Nitrospirota bacterium]
MFTGLVETLGVVASSERRARGMRLSVKPLSEMEVKIGDSVSVNGVCLTATTDGRTLLFDLSPETVKSSNLGELKANERVNLERALRLSDRFGGHMVSGHVDTVGTIKDRRQAGEYTLYTFSASPETLRYIVKKGSVAIDGISLTVTEVDDQSFSVSIIPHTLTATNIGDKKRGDKVNIEVDIIGKYVEKLLAGGGGSSNLEALLREKGFAD